MSRVKRIVAAAAVAGVGVALMAACSSSGGGGKGGGSAPPPTNAAANAKNDMVPTARTAVKQGGTFVWGISQTIPNFNYYELDGTLQDNVYILNAILPNPFHFDAAGKATVNTDYFTSITKTSDSPLTIDYKINPKAKWSDGSAISWQDLAAEAKANTGKDTTYKISGSQGWDQIQDVKQGANEQEAIVTFAKPFGDWQSLFAPLYPHSVNDTAAAFNTSWVDHPLVTAGPFKWGSQDKTAQSYTIVKDPNWWGNQAKLDSITFKAYDSPAAAVQAMGSHQVDYYDISGGSAYQNMQALRQYTGVAIRQAGGVNFRQFTFNTKDATLSDPQVRQAVFLGIDRARITTLLMGNLGGTPTPLNNHLFMKNQAPYKEECGDLCTYNPTKAKQILEADGWKLNGTYYAKNGKTLSLAITVPADTPNAVQESETAQATLKAAGIKLTLVTVPSSDFFAKYINVGKFQITTFTWLGTPFPVGSSVSIYKYDPKNVGQNYGSGGNDTINTLLTNAIQQIDPAKEYDQANQADAEIWKNAAWLPLYQRPQIFGVNDKLVNLGAPGFADYRYEDIGFKA
jgi:peptide/nickel transport system substrate-binding protein